MKTSVLCLFILLGVVSGQTTEDENAVLECLFPCEGVNSPCPDNSTQCVPSLGCYVCYPGRPGDVCDVNPDSCAFSMNCISKHPMKDLGKCTLFDNEDNEAHGQMQDRGVNVNIDVNIENN